MRVKCFFYPETTIEQLSIPMDFRRHFISFIKTLLLDSSFYQRFEKEKPGYSPYVFGVEFAKIVDIDSERQEISVQPPVILTISTSLFNLFTDMCNSAIVNKDKSNVLGLKLSRINLLPLKQIRSNTVEFRIVGHAALRGEDDYADPGKKKQLEEATNTHMRTKMDFLNRVYFSSSEIHFTPVVFTDYRKLTKGVCQHYGGKITTIKGNVTLTSSPDCLQFLYDFGLGVRTGQGFGLLEVVKQHEGY